MTHGVLDGSGGLFIYNADVIHRLGSDGADVWSVPTAFQSGPWAPVIDPLERVLIVVGSLPEVQMIGLDGSDQGGFTWDPGEDGYGLNRSIVSVREDTIALNGYVVRPGPYNPIQKANLVLMRLDGQLIWSFELPGNLDMIIYPVLDADGGIVFADAGMRLTIGRIMPMVGIDWQIAVGEIGPDTETNIIVGGLAVGFGGDTVAATKQVEVLTISGSGQLEWLVQRPDDWVGGPVLGPDRAVFLCSRDGEILALEPDGTLRWRLLLNAEPDLEMPARDFPTTSPTVLENGHLVVPMISGDLVFVDSRSGRKLFSYRLPNGLFSSHAPLVAPDGRMYVTADRYVIALDTIYRGLAAGSWPREYADQGCRCSPAGAP